MFVLSFPRSNFRRTNLALLIVSDYLARIKAYLINTTELYPDRKRPFLTLGNLNWARLLEASADYDLQNIPINVFSHKSN